MAILGTKKFWKPSLGASATQKENQILKNAGYINIQIHSVNYMSKGDFFQSIFGGNDTIALATNLKYQSGTDTIDATSVQDTRKVKTDRNYNFGIRKDLAVKIPSTANSLAIEVKMTVIKDDNLQAKFDMLNKSDYQPALHLLPTVVGQVITITSLVKRLFTDSDPDTQLEASFAGIISLESVDNPVEKGKLTSGMLIMVSTDEGETFSNVDETKFEIRGDELYYKNTIVQNTYIIFNISFEALKGDDQNSIWFKKYNEALNNLDRIMLTTDETEILKIYTDSKNLWIEGNALIEADGTYINSERMKLKAAAIKAINDKYNELKPTVSNPAGSTASVRTELTPELSQDILKGLTGNSSFHSFTESFPATGSFLNSINDNNSHKPISDSLFLKLSDNNTNMFGFLEEDTNNYLKDLKSQKIDFRLGQV